MKLATPTDRDLRKPELDGLYSTHALAEIIGVPTERICLWISQDLLEPTARDGESFYFDFKQMSAAQTLRELAESGASLKKLRRGVKRLRKWLPEPAAQQQSGQRPALVEQDGQLHVRLDGGELAEADGQLRLEFDGEPSPIQIRTSPQSPGGWFERGAEYEAEGQFDAAIEAYREALKLGGPDAKVCFALAHALAAAGLHAQAAERYLQVVEIDPQDADAWNNLGTVLSALDQHDGACRAFREALQIRPDDARAHYNLADALDERGNPAAAAQHWQAYLRHDSSSRWAAHARRRLATI